MAVVNILFCVPSLAELVNCLHYVFCQVILLHKVIVLFVHVIAKFSSYTTVLYG